MSGVCPPTSESSSTPVSIMKSKDLLIIVTTLAFYRKDRLLAIWTMQKSLGTGIKAETEQIRWLWERYVVYDASTILDHASRLILLPKRPYNAALSSFISSRNSVSLSSTPETSVSMRSTKIHLIESDFTANVHQHIKSFSTLPGYIQFRENDSVIMHPETFKLRWLARTRRRRRTREKKRYFNVLNSIRLERRYIERNESEYHQWQEYVQ